MTANHWSISTLQQLQQNNIISKPSNIYIYIPKFENYFSLFENIAKNLQEEYSISNKMFAEAFSCVKDAATELSRIWECPYNYFILKKTRSGILCKLQTDNFIHVTSPDNGRVALILNKADYYTKVNAIQSDGYKIQSPSN